MKLSKMSLHYCTSITAETRASPVEVAWSVHVTVVPGAGEAVKTPIVSSPEVPSLSNTSMTTSELSCRAK